MGKLAARFIFDLILAAFILEGWWFAAVIVGAFALWANDYYAEVLIAGLAYDSLYGLSAEHGIRGYVGIFVAAILTIAVSLFKRMVRR